MSTKILVCLDGSQRAEGALPYAMACAREAGPEAEILLARVPEPLGLTPPEIHEAILKGLLEQISTYLEGLAKKLQELGYKASTRAPCGSVCETILELADTEGVSLVLITSHGRTGPGRWLLGSVAERIARHSPAPVLLLPVASISRARWEIADLPRFQSVVIPADGSALSETALEFSRLVPIRPQKAHLVMGTDVPEFLGRSLLKRDIDELLGRIEAYLEDLARAPGLKGCEVAVRACDRMPADAILFVARDVRADLIVMATRGQGGLSRLMAGSVAEKVARASSCPVLLINPACVTDAVKTPVPSSSTWWP